MRTSRRSRRSLESATDIGAPFYPLLRELLRKAWKQRRALRLVSVKLSGIDDGPAQMDIFGGKDEKRRRLAGVMDRLNKTGDSAALILGHQLESQKKSSKDERIK